MIKIAMPPAIPGLILTQDKWFCDELTKNGKDIFLFDAFHSTIVISRHQFISLNIRSLNER